MTVQPSLGACDPRLELSGLPSEILVQQDAGGRRRVAREHLTGSLPLAGRAAGTQDRRHLECGYRGPGDTRVAVSQFLHGYEQRVRRLSRAGPGPCTGRIPGKWRWSTNGHHSL